MLGLVSNVAAKVATDDAVPRRVVLLVKLLLDISGNVLWSGAHKSRGGCEMVRAHCIYLLPLERPFEKRGGGTTPTFHHPFCPRPISQNNTTTSCRLFQPPPNTNGVLHALNFGQCNAAPPPFRAHLLDVVLGQGLRRAVHGLLLHVLRHVGVLDHCLPLLRHALLVLLVAPCRVAL